MSICEIPVTTPKNPLKCHNLLTDVKNGIIEFTPEFAMEFMQSTDNRKNMAVLMEILENHLAAHPETAPEYQRILFGIIGRTNQREQTIVKAQELLSEYNISKMEVFISQSEADYCAERIDFTHVSRLTFDAKVVRIEFKECDLSETKLDFSQEKWLTNVSFTQCKMPSTIELSSKRFWRISFSDMDLTNFKQICPTPIYYLDFANNTKFPSVLDLSSIEEVKSLQFKKCDMRNVKHIEFPKNLEKIYLEEVYVPACMDIETLEKNYSVVYWECQFAEPVLEEPTQPVMNETPERTTENNLWQQLKNMITTKGR